MDEAEDRIVQRLAAKFVETSLDKLDDMEARLLRLESGGPIGAALLAEIKRNIHSIKSQGETFGFPLVSRIAHLLEDYLTLPRRPDVKDVCAFIRPMADILREGRNPSPQETSSILSGLPVIRARTRPRPASKGVHVHLAMRPGLHERIAKRELTSCGFRVSQSDDAAKSLTIVMTELPDIVIADLELKSFSGVELARWLNMVDATRHIRFVLLTSARKNDPRLNGLPPEAATIIAVDTNYAFSLGNLLVKWGMFLPVGNPQPSLKDMGPNFQS